MITILKKIPFLFLIFCLPVFVQAETKVSPPTQPQSNLITVSYGQFGVGFSFDPVKLNHYTTLEDIQDKEKLLFKSKQPGLAGLFISVETYPGSVNEFDQIIEKEVQRLKTVENTTVFGVRKNFKLNAKIESATEYFFSGKVKDIGFFCQSTFFKAHQKIKRITTCAKNTDLIKKLVADLMPTIFIPAESDKGLRVTYPAMNIRVSELDKDWVFVCKQKSKCSFKRLSSQFNSANLIKLDFDLVDEAVATLSEWELVWNYSYEKNPTDDFKLGKTTIGGKEARYVEYHLKSKTGKTLKKRYFAYPLPNKRIVTLEFYTPLAEFDKKAALVDALISKIQFLK